MFAIIVGCGRVGADLAWRLFKGGHQVTIIDHVGASFQHLHPDYRGRTIEAEVLNQGVLEQAGAAQADGLAAVTNSDATNAVVAHVARSVYLIRNVVARNYDPRWRPVHESFGVQTVSSTAWGAQRIEEVLSGTPLRSVFSAGNGEVEVYEAVVGEAWAGRRLGELVEGIECLPVAHSRAGRAQLPTYETALSAGDLVHVSASFAGAAALRQRRETGRV